MDPVSIFLILVAEPVIKKTAAELFTEWAVNGVLSSYIANHIPTIYKLFKSKKTLDDVLEKTYNKAVHNWCNSDGIERPALSKRFIDLDKLVTYIQEDSFESESIANQLCLNWFEELKKEELGRRFIKEIQERNLIKISKETNELVLSMSQKVNDIHEALCSFHTEGKTEFEEDTTYISRMCYRIEEKKVRLMGYQGESLYDIVLTSENKHFVLLSAPLMGKTTELKHLCWLFSKNKHYKPVLFELKNNSDMIRKEQLPSKDYVDDKAIVLVIDAIDEVSEYRFRRQINEIRGYAELHPKMRIVLSCRSNYSHLIDSDVFMTVNLGTLTSDQIERIVLSNNSSLNGEEFISDMDSQDLFELTTCPFFLNELIDYYVENGGLPNTKAKLFDHLVTRSYRIEEEKQISDELVIHDERDYLEKVAFVMLLKGKQIISRNDLYECLGEDERLFNRTVHFGVLDCTDDKDNLSFQYNSIKEYLAASYLAKMPIDNIKALVCIENSGRVISHWFNTICLYVEIVSNNNGGIIPDDVYNWLSKENKDILLHTNKNFVNKEKRPKLLIDYIREENEGSRLINRNNRESLEQIVNYGMGGELASFILDELRSINVYDLKFANLIGVVQYMDWDILYKEYTLLATQLENTLLSFIDADNQLFNEATSWVCSKWILNESCKNKDLLKRIVQKAIANKSPHLINITLVAIANASYEDDFYNEIKQLQEYISETNGILDRHNVYAVYSQLKNPDNVNDAFTYITKSIFHPNDFSMDDDFRKMEKTLLKTAEAIVNNGDQRLVGTIKNAIVDRFNNYGLINLDKRTSVADDYKQFFVSTGTWDTVSNEIESLFNFELYQRNDAAANKLRTIREQQYKELMSEALFRDVILNIINKQEDIEVDEIWFKCCNSPDSINQHAARFIVNYTKKKGGKTFIDKTAVENAISNSSTYSNFMFEESIEILNGHNCDFELDENELYQVVEHAKRLIYNLCDESTDIITKNQMNAIELMLKGYFTISTDRLIKLIRFSGVRFSLNIDYLWDDDKCSLFEYICSNSGIENVKDFITKELVDNTLTIPDYNFRIWSSFAIRYQLKETYPSIIKRIIKTPEESLLIQERLIQNPELKELIISSAEDGSLTNIAVLAILFKSIMEKNSDYNKRIQAILEKDIDNMDIETAKAVLPILVELGSKSALSYLEKNPDALEGCEICKFNYSGQDSVDQLIQLYGYFSNKMSLIHNPCSSILNNITDIALESTEVRVGVESKMIKLSEVREDLQPNISRWLYVVRDMAAAKYFKNEDIKEIMNLIE